MNKLVLLLALALSSLFAQQTLNAQTRPLPYDPPAGWKFLRHLDGIHSVKLQGAGDTVFLKGSDEGAVMMASTDAGSSWESLTHLTVLPGTGRFYTFRLIDGYYHFGTSTDFGKTYTFHKTNIARVPLRTFYVNPHDPNDFIIHLSITQGHEQITYERFGRSTDGGVTWNQLMVPLPKDGEGEYYTLGFDLLTPGRWYLMVHASLRGEVRTLYRTTDNGETFDPLWTKQGAGFPPEPFSAIGLDGPGTFRKWWKPNGNATQGVYVLNEDIEPIDSIDFLQNGLGSRLDELSRKYNTISVFSTLFSPILGQPFTYRLFMGGSNWNGKDTIFEQLQYRMESFDGGRTWSIRDSSINTPFAVGWWTLPGSDRSYILTQDTFEVKRPPQAEQYSFWALETPASAVSGTKNSAQLRISPNPGSGEYTLDVRGWTSSDLSLEVIDLNGKRMFASSVMPHAENFEIPLSVSLISGTYWVLVRGKDQQLSASFIVQK